MSANSSGSGQIGGGASSPEIKPSIPLPEIDMKDVRRRIRGQQGAEGEPSPYPYDEQCAVKEPRFLSMRDPEKNQGHEMDKSNPTLAKPHVEKTSKAPNQPTGGPPFAKSCLPGISTTRRPINSSTSQTELDCKKNAEGVKTETLHSSAAGSSKRSSSEAPTAQTGMTFLTKAVEIGTRSLHSTTRSSNRLSFGDGNNSSIKARQGDMSEMKKEKSSELCPSTMLSHSQQSTDQTGPFNNKFFSEPVSPSTDSQQVETHPKAEDQKSVRNIRINIQRGSQYPSEFPLQCSFVEYFEWTYCLIKSPETLKNTLKKAGIDMHFLLNKPPVFRILQNQRDIAELIQQAFRETVKQINLAYHFFDWDMSRPEKDFESFCKNWNDIKDYPSVFLSWDKWCERVILCLVGEKTQVEIVKALVESELQMKFSIENKENAEFFTWRTPTKGKWARVLQASKDNLERDFPVKISYEPNSEIEISAKTKDVVKRVFERVKEISKCVQPLELPKEHMFLLHSEKAQLYIKTELKMQFGWILHFLPIEMDEPDILHVYEENNTELNNISLKIMKCLFLIPSTDKLCQIFTSDLGRRLSKNLAEHNEGKVQIVLDITNQPCCVGTKDLEEKMKVTLAKYMLNREIIKLPSEEVWRFCQKHSIFENIARELCCEVQLSDHQLTVEIIGPAQLVSEVSGKIEMEVKKITSKTVIQMDISNESEITKLIMNWNAEKRCFVSVRNVKSKTSAPWKKWVQKKGMNINLVYSVNLNISQEVQEDEFKVVLKPEELDGARSKNPIEHIHGFPYHVHLLVPSSENGKFKDIVTTRFKDIIKFNKENWKKRSMIVDCDGVPVQELNISMKNMCHTLDTTNASDLCITKCEFCDKRFHVFDSMTRVIETHLKKKHYEVMEWKGRSIEMEVFSGQLAQQKGLDVIVNSASKSLDLKAGFVSRSILNAAGPGIQTELNNGYREGLNEGEIAVTKGYDLSCRFVFHGVLRGYSSWDNFRCLRKIIRTCLEKADTLMMESIAFPALGTGNLGYSRRDVANVLFEEVEAYEKKVKIGSLNRVCCVIYEKDTLAIQEFTRRHSLWKQDHKVQNVQKQVMVTSDKADVIEEICQELKQIQHHKANMTEPPISEITDTMRLGKPSTTGVGMESNIMRKKVNGSSQLLDDLSEEKRCLLVKGREDFEKDVHAWEKRLRNDFINMAENIVCPFHHPNQALVQFPSENDVAEVFKDRNLNEKYMVLKFPSQAVVGLEAVVTPGMVQLLEQREVTISEIRSKSGVAVQQKDSNTMVLSGNILEIKAAFTFFSSLVKDAPSDGKEIKKTEKLPIEEKIPQDHLPRVSGKMGNDDDLVKQGQISEQVSDISSKEVIKSTPGNEHAGFDKSSVSTKGSSSKKKFNTSNVMQLKCTDEEVTKLKHFFRNLMINVDETRDPDQSHIYLLFLDKDTKIKVEESLQKIRDMPGSIIQLQKTFDGIEETLAKESTEDAFCYLSKDRRQIELIGIDRGNLQRIKEKLTGLLYSERQIVKESCESQKDTVFVTNEGISVFVECTSILNIGKPVDAIVCPISKQCDIKSGLPKAIADLAGPAYVKELTDIFDKNEKMFPYEFVCAIPARDCKTCKYVINVTTKQWKKGKTESKECELFLLKQMTQVLLKAEERRIRSIAIPAICSGNCRYPKEVCALCYATAVLMYSRTIRDSKNALHEICFVDQSPEMITLIKSVFTHPNVVETAQMKERELLQNCSVSELYPYFSHEDGLFFLSENLKLRILDSTDLKPYLSKRTLVYHKSLGKMEKSIKENWLPDNSRKEIKESKAVFFCKQKSEMSEIPNVIFPRLDNPVSETFSKALSTFYFKIFHEAQQQSVCHMMLPFYGSIKGNFDLSRNSAQRLINELHKFAERLTTETAVDIAMPIADKQTREIIWKEIEQYVESERAGFQRV